MQESCHAVANIKSTRNPLYFKRVLWGPLVVTAIIWARNVACVGKKKKLVVVVCQPERFTKFG